jgi:hypothetical protein
MEKMGQAQAAAESEDGLKNQASAEFKKMN